MLRSKICQLRAALSSVAQGEGVMDTKTALYTLNDRFHAALTGALSDLTDEQLYAIAPAIDQRPIVEVARHAYSNVLGLFAVAAGNEWSLATWPLSDWPADEPHPTTTSALLARLGELHIQATGFLETLPAERLDEEVTLPWGSQQAGEAIIDILVHGFHHVGAVAAIRAIAGFPTPPDE
jgi:uncharacterized damage-inducible protein DinB